jgi:hypothetical protein
VCLFCACVVCEFECLCRVVHVRYMILGAFDSAYFVL